MKRLLPLLLLTNLVLSCNKQHQFMGTGLILGEDTRMCACCGGLEFTFSDSLHPTNFVLITNPEFLKPPANVTYPVQISLDWDTASSCGTTRRIKVVGFLTKWK